MGAGNAEDCERNLALSNGLWVFRAHDDAEGAGGHPDEEAARDNRSGHGHDTGVLAVLVVEDMAAGNIAAAAAAAAAEGMVAVDDRAVVVGGGGMFVAENMLGQGLPAEHWYSSPGPKVVERHWDLAEA